MGQQVQTSQDHEISVKVSFTGHWNIEDTQLWDRDFLDIFEPAHLNTVRKAVISGSYPLGCQRPIR